MTITYSGPAIKRAFTRCRFGQRPVLILQPDEPLREASRGAAVLFPDARFVELPTLSRDVFDVGAGTCSQAMTEFLI